MRNLFIICEGPDNVGKSTLIQNLKNALNTMVFSTLHYSNVKQPSAETAISYNKKLYTQMFQQMLEISRYDDSGVICDRSHLGEMVYGPIYRGYSGEYVLDIERAFKHIGPVWDNLVLITMYDDPENLVARDDGLSYSTEIKTKMVEIQNFKNAHDKSNIKRKLLLNINDHDAEHALLAVLSFIKGEQK